MKRLLILILLLLAASFIFFIVAKKSSEISNSSKLRITASFYPMYFFTSQIGKDKVDVTNITPPGAEPHDYEPSPSDIIKIQQSKLLVMNGNIEPWADKIKKNLIGKNVNVITVGQEATDTHIWLSPTKAKIESQKIALALENLDPANSNYYKNNLTNLENELDKIDTAYKTGLKNCELRSFVTSHAAFGYLAKDYGLTQIAINGLSPDAEPSLAKLAQIADFAKKNNVETIFFESLVSPKLSETIASEIGAKTMILDPIEGINDVNQTKGINYLTLMSSNLQNLKIALKCQ